MLALLRYAWPFLCLGSNGRWNFIWLFQPCFGDLIYGLAAASVPSCGSFSHVRDGFSLQAFLNLPEICLSQIILSSVFHCGVFVVAGVFFFFFFNFSNVVSCWERRWRTCQQLLSIHPALTVVFSERSAKQRVGLHGSGTGGSLPG